MFKLINKDKLNLFIVQSYTLSKDLFKVEGVLGAKNRTNNFYIIDIKNCAKC